MDSKKIVLRNCGVDPLEALFGHAYDDLRQSVDDEIAISDIHRRH
jgi:hypothetical protein